jgi:hypothetical protein
VVSSYDGYTSYLLVIDKASWYAWVFLRVDKWRINLRGAWLIKIGCTMVSTISEAQLAFRALYDAGTPFVTLLFSHPEIHRDISNKGLPIVSSAPFSQQTHDQLNRRWDFTTVADFLCKAPPYKVVDSG